MSASSGDDLGRLVTDLVTTLRELETEIEPTTENGLPRPPTPKELLRFTSDVTIPAAILLLKTNIEALKLLRRALRLAEGRPTSTGSSAQQVQQRATQLSRATLSRLDDALTDLQRAVEGTPQDEDAREILQEAKQLREELSEKLQEQAAKQTQIDAVDDDTATDVPVDVDAELRSIKDDIDDLTDDVDRSNGDENDDEEEGS